MIEQARKTLKPDNRQANKQAEMERFVEEARKEKRKNQAFKTADEKKRQRQAQPAYKRAVEASKKKSLEKSIAKARRSVNPTREIERQLFEAERSLRNAGLADSVIKIALKSAERELRKVAK